MSRISAAVLAALLLAMSAFAIGLFPTSFVDFRATSGGVADFLAR